MKVFSLAVTTLILGCSVLLGQSSQPTQESQSTRTVPLDGNTLQANPIDMEPTCDESPTQKSTSVALEPDKTDMERIAFIHREKLPDSPTPNFALQKEGGGCPGRAGSPCALLGGFRYYSDLWKTGEHEGSWWDALKTPGMILAVSSLVSTTVLDIQGTQACIDAGTCRELNPLMGQHSLARKYALAVPLSAFVIWGSVREKQHGHGTTAMLLLWGASCVHFYFGAGGFNAAKIH